MIKSVFLLSACLVSLSSALFFSGAEWDGLCVTFGINPLNPYVLDGLPRTEDAAIEQGWVKIADCDTTGKFRGARYVKDNDYAVVLLYDVNGYIAGIQCGIAKSGLPHDYPPPKQRGHIFQDDGDHFTLTAYFTDPAQICTSGRTPHQFSEEGTGTALYIQNGSDPLTHSVQIPNAQEDLVHTSWTEGYCFRLRMGIHYWYNVSEDMKCEDFQPVFLLYNKQRLNAFGWALGVDQLSGRFEHPKHRQISKFINPAPECLNDYPRLSTMHIYMTAHPSFNFC